MADSYILLETGDKVLQETGDKLILEDGLDKTDIALSTAAVSNAAIYSFSATTLTLSSAHQSSAAIYSAAR